MALAELVREQALARTREEVPHSIEVQVEEIEPRDDLTVVRAVLWVETESQKGILIGKGGSMIREIGTARAQEIERELGRRVHLDLTVKVRKRLAPRRGPARPARHRGSEAVPARLRRIARRMRAMDVDSVIEGEDRVRRRRPRPCVAQDWRPARC